MNLHKYLKKLMEDEAEKNKTWSQDDFFYIMKQLSIDQRGRVGEHFFRDVFKELNFNVEYINNGHDDFDLIVNNLKIEIKTATLDVNQKFQHEGIKESKKWDYIAFLDISPNDIYISFIHKNLFKFGIEKLIPETKRKKQYERISGTFVINGSKYNCHFRGKDSQTNAKATGAGYKVDLKIKDLKKIKTIKDFENLFLETIKQNNNDKIL